jgi:phosphoglycerate kinase
MKQINEYNFSGKRALVRLDLNVPLNESFEVTDTTRIDAAIPTILKIVNEGGAAILMSHLGRPKGERNGKYSLKHIVSALSQKLGKEVKFVSDCIGDEVQQAVATLGAGEILLLENLRFHKAETEGDAGFAKKLADIADVYVNDAFGTAHRAHASTAIVASFFGEEKMFGYVIEEEMAAVEKVIENNQRPFTAIMGGAKISDKILLIEKMLDKVDNLIIGGGMSYTFFKAMGGKVGKSLVEEDKINLAKTILRLAKEKEVNLFLPVDSIVADDFNNEANTDVADNMHIPEGFMGLDIGPKAVEQFGSIIRKSKTILWNGPMGVFEMSNFAYGTKEVAQAIADATDDGAYSLIGGGDSTAAINQLNFTDKVSYISTGGGALLEYLEGKKLPGIAAIMD